ncbi:MAG: virulence factor [Rhodobacteraceae bacterium]|nr:virulence factor [Paracoccaceae bacterium]
MPKVTIVYWRDIPAQVIVGRGRKAAKVQLSERFEQAIDRAAMRVGAADTDAYLAEWRRSTGEDVAGEPQNVAQAEASRLEAEYDKVRLMALIDADGHEKLADG